MEYQLGDIIKEKRIELGYTQQELADMSGYTRTLISKIEQSKRKPSEDLLLELSYLLSFDFVSLQKNLGKYKSFNHYTLFYELSQAVEVRDNDKVKKLLKNKLIKDEFTYGETYILREYCKCLIYLSDETTLSKANKLCIKVLNIDVNSINTHRIKLNQPNYYYSLYFIFEYVLYNQGNFNNELELLENIRQFLEKNYFNSIFPLASIDYFFKKLYIVTLNNLADVSFRLHNYEDTLLYCDKCIEKSKELNVLNILYDILSLKTETLYTIGDKEAAILSYNNLHSFCQLTNHTDFFEKHIEMLKSKYPDFL